MKAIPWLWNAGIPRNARFSSGPIPEFQDSGIPGNSVLLALPGADEGHPVGPEMRLEAELALEASPANFAFQLSLGSVRAGSGIPVPAALGSASRILGIGRSLLLFVGDEAVAVEGNLGSEAEAAFPALLGIPVRAVLRDVGLEFRPASRQESALAAAERGLAAGFGVLGGGGGAVGLLAAGVVRGELPLAAGHLGKGNLGILGVWIKAGAGSWGWTTPRELGPLPAGIPG